MKTPSKARECWCPFARVAESENGTSNRFMALLKRVFSVEEFPKWDDEMACRCIAEECMAWRWVYSEPFPGADNLGRAGTVMEQHATDKGFCGLAGKP